mmetsp:Transcript_18587/g.33291  ORF Transcript_18587/g.33291 Transcript_18587/m.33291 type:complete len:182 (-) Transcript_18587:353-898(-)
MNVLWWLTILIQWVPFAFYTYIWQDPESWVKFCLSLKGKPDPSALVSHIAHVIKACQYIALFSVGTLVIPPWYNIILAAAGQYLNYKVYTLIGRDGVYYGARFGKAIPWVTEFPFGTMRDPQYIGCILTTIAASSNIPFTHVAAILAGYTYMIIVESKERTPRAKIPSPHAGIQGTQRVGG